MIAEVDHPSALRVAVLGGHDPAALERVIAGVPQGEGIALVVACPNSNGELTAKLREGPRPVTEVRGRARVERDRVLIVPADHVGWFQRSELFTEFAPDSTAPIDRLLRTAADELGRDTTGVILAGRGTDGVIGIKRLKEAGGLTIAQRTDGEDGELPRAAIATGMIDLVLGADEIGSRLSELTREPVPIEPDGTVSADAPETLREIIALLRNRTGHDFASYKRATLHRRVARRMQVCGGATATEYQAYLHEHPAELSNLLRDFLISVTNFFRDRESFDALDRTVIPQLFTGKKAEDLVRVWVPGCATGEEAYSIAILLAEHAARLPSPPQCQVFATDIDDTALSEARAGVYPATIALDVSPERIARFFIEDGEQLRVNDAIREMILFSSHNVLRDPPFSRLDMISCRNLLIYFNRDAQDRVFNVFHFALRPDGYLFLGSSESAEGSSLFTPLDSRSRTFTRRLASSTLGISPFIPHRRWEAPLPPAPVVARERDFSAGQLHHQLLERYAPPSILVNAELQASNEELQAINEELRSATEELETGKEELQSVNEELITLNQELKIKLDELAQSEERLAFALRSAPIVIISHAPDGEATWGYAMGTELGGPKVLELFAPGHAERYMSAIREALADRSARRVELDLVIDGQLRTYDFRLEASEKGAHGIAFDITPSKLAEIALVDADRRKDEFLATLSHELRNPLTPLKVALDVMRVAKDPTQLSRSREIMERQVAMLEGLVNELLDLSRITQGRITLDRQPIGVTELVEAALEIIRPSIAERGHRLQVHLPEIAVVILGDRARLIQVLTNLLGNAVKYTPPGGDIELVVSVNAKRKRLEIHVRDTGMGIAPDMLTRIFDIFVQSRDAQGRSQGGLGIGLNLVRRLVALHGGTVSATSDGPDLGSEFVVELPLP